MVPHRTFRFRLVFPAVSLLAAGAVALTTLPAGSTGLDATPAPSVRWGEDGHRMAARVAFEALPAGLPGFFMDAGAQLAYLNPEPDRWRTRELPAMDQGFAYDHYIDLENVPAGALDAPHRWEYVRRLYQAGMEVPERDGGFLPYRMLELYQRLVTEWRLWRAADEPTRRWIEERIVNDAGVLGHYVTDASQPHHTTIHFNGWNASAPNPHGYTTARDFHSRFESGFVSAHVGIADVGAAFPASPPRRFEDPWAAILDHILESHAEVERLYQLERRARFDPGAGAPAEHRAFAAERLAAGASMLRDLWWSAWLESAESLDGERR
jgi:hypothetical protein